MAEEDMIAMSQEDLKRLHLIRKAIDRIITQQEAAEMIGVGLRQAQRIVRRVRIEGNRGIVHKSRGAPSNRATPPKIKDKALKLFKDKYPDFGPTLASEKLWERDKIKVNDETLRLWLIKDNLPYKKRKKQPHRQWRERKYRSGQMIQMDGSEHDWLEGRGPYCVFMGYIDDATGEPFGRFYEYEGTIPAMDSFKCYIKKRGIPLSVYLDKHTTYKSTGKPSIEDQLNNLAPLSQFERALKELGVEVIHANSPQAKGRVERLFKTFQDRLIKELRLEKVKTIAGANKALERFLPKYARKFAVKARHSGDLHRALPKGMDLEKILCVKTERALRNDFTAAHDTKLYQIEDNLRADKVMIEERTDGSMLITHKNSPLKFKEITQRPRKEESKNKYEFRLRRVYMPPAADHPWKRFRVSSQYKQHAQKEKVGQKEKELLLTKI